MWTAFRKMTDIKCMMCVCLIVGIAGWSLLSRQKSLQAFSASGMARDATIVIDAGHGGEDGGAVSREGIEESGLNLSIAFKVRDILRLTGCRTVMTREDDVSIGDASLGTVRARKASDIRRRVEIVNGTQNAILLSIHQNSLPESPVTHGAQVFWNAWDGGEALAKSIQAALNERINVGNEKRAYPMNSGVYLMKHAEAAGALVECGFLSNAWEAVRLTEDAYQKELAVTISAGYLRYASGEGIT